MSGEDVVGASQRANKRKVLHMLDDAEESLLAKKLFGVASSDLYSSDEDINSDDDAEVLQTTAPATSNAVWQDDDDLGEDEIELPKKKAAVFLKKSTDGGEKIQKREYQERLKAHFTRTHNAGKVPTWATGQRKVNVLHEDDSDDEVDAALKVMTKSVGKYVEKSEFLPKTVVQTNLLPEITVGHHDGKSLSALRFHRSKNVILTADKGGSVKLYEVDSDAKKEHFLQKIRFPKFPISSMDFAGGDSVICGATNQEYLMRYNFVSGDVTQLRMPQNIQRQAVGHFAISTDGKIIAMVGFSNQVHVISSISMEHIQTVSVPSPVASVTFLPGSSNELWILCENGQVNFWKCSTSSLHSFIDEGTIRGTKIAFSPDGFYLACASNSGIVNVYETATAKLSVEPKPVAVNKGLVTSCDSLAFNHDSQVLAVGSSVKTNQLRMFHMRSKTVFTNFPQPYEKIRNGTCLEFSPHSGYLAVGCQDGRLRLYRMSHFNDY